MKTVDGTSHAEWLVLSSIPSADAIRRLQSLHGVSSVEESSISGVLSVMCKDDVIPTIESQEFTKRCLPASSSLNSYYVKVVPECHGRLNVAGIMNSMEDLISEHMLEYDGYFTNYFNDGFVMYASERLANFVNGWDKVEQIVQVK